MKTGEKVHQRVEKWKKGASEELKTGEKVRQEFEKQKKAHQKAWKRESWYIRKA